MGCALLEEEFYNVVPKGDEGTSWMCGRHFAEKNLFLSKTFSYWFMLILISLPRYDDFQSTDILTNHLVSPSTPFLPLARLLGRMAFGPFHCYAKCRGAVLAKLSYYHSFVGSRENVQGYFR